MIIKLLKRIFFKKPIYGYFVTYNNKFYGLCGCNVYLTRIDFSCAHLLLLSDCYYSNKLNITKEKYEKIKLTPNSVCMEIDQ